MAKSRIDCAQAVTRHWSDPISPLHLCALLVASISLQRSSRRRRGHWRLAGLDLLAIPGVDPVVAAGWLVATVAGAAAGGTTGGIVGALTQAGVSDEDVQVYAEGVRRGGTLVTAPVNDADASRLDAVLDRSALRSEGDSAKLFLPSKRFGELIAFVQ
jgi:hypothetical protein